MYIALSLLCMFLKIMYMYMYTIFFCFFPNTNRKQKILEKALVTPRVEPARLRYKLHVNTWCVIPCAYRPFIPLEVGYLSLADPGGGGGGGAPGARPPNGRGHMIFLCSKR